MFRIEQSDCIQFLRKQEADSVDLIFGSPPYETQRSYGIGFDKAGEEWVSWMVEVFRESVRVCKGLVAMVVEGSTKNYRWSAVPSLLEADLHRAGYNLRHSIAFCRVGIPGSGGPDWFRNDHERIICVTRTGKLPWSDNTACGHPPKWVPGGEMSHRLADGQKVNQWGGREGRMPRGSGDKQYRGDNSSLGYIEVQGWRPSHRLGRGMANGIPGSTKGGCVGKKHTKIVTTPEGDTVEQQFYLPPVLANPGNVVEAAYSAEQVARLLEQGGDVMKLNVGGGLMGSKYAHRNEAPFPLSLAERFVRSFCPPDGVVCDPFLGSGTTAHAALKWGRKFIGCDIREEMVDLASMRLNQEAMPLLA